MKRTNEDIAKYLDIATTAVTFSSFIQDLQKIMTFDEIAEKFEISKFRLMKLMTGEIIHNMYDVAKFFGDNQTIEVQLAKVVEPRLFVNPVDHDKFAVMETLGHTYGWWKKRFATVGINIDKMPTTLAYRVWKLRMMENKTVAECARAIRVATGTWYNIEKGKTRYGSVPTLDKIADYFGVTREFLLAKGQTARMPTKAEIKEMLSSIEKNLLKKYEDRTISKRDLRRMHELAMSHPYFSEVVMAVTTARFEAEISKA